MFYIIKLFREFLFSTANNRRKKAKTQNLKNIKTCKLKNYHYLCTMTEKKLRIKDMSITVEQVYHQMGGSPQHVDDSLLDEISQIIVWAEDKIHPSFCYQILRGELTSNCLSFNDSIFHVKHTIASELNGSEAFALFVATAGENYTELSRWPDIKKDLVKSSIMDALGSIIAERSADAMEISLQESIDKLGWHHTNRYSPGYCGWDIREQQELFRLLGDTPCGVTLNDSCLMSPIKSISGVVGIGKQVARHDYRCKLCGRKNCYLRC